MSLYALFTGKGETGFGHASTAEQVTEGLDLTGQRILVTGCNSGIGLETVRVLSQRGATILGAARDREKARAALSGLHGPTVALACELSEPDSVRACAAEIRDQKEPLSAIIANAGIMALPSLQQKHGVELQFFTNHIGHFILVNELVDALRDDGRVVMVSSDAHTKAPKGGIELDNLSGEKGYSPWGAYGQSKLANILFTKTLKERLAGSNRVAIAIHPGVIATNLARHMNPVARGIFGMFGPLFLKSAAQGAATQVFAAVHPKAAAYNGAFLANCNPATPSEAALDEALGAKLWQASEEIVSGLRAAA